MIFMKLFRYFCFTFSLVTSTLFGVNDFSVTEVKTNIDTSLTNSEQSTAKEQASGITTDFNVILLPLNANGDATIIDYGDCEILIDAGGGANSGSIIYDALNTYIDDGKIELIIITHSDSDHLISFSDEGVGKWLKESNHSCDYLIDFDIKNDKTITIPYLNNFFKNESDNSKDDGDEEEIDNPSTSLKTPYSNYIDERNELISLNKIKNYLTASECTYEKRGIKKSELRKEASSTARDEFIFDANGEISDNSENSVKVKILYNYFYDHPADTTFNSVHVPQAYELNLISVCNLVEFCGEKYLFTGDLVEYNSGASYAYVGGESYLMENNQEELKDGVLFFKAGHHGSLTSNSMRFINYIRPQYVGINCVAALVNFDFPKDVVLNNFCKWTDYIYITQYRDSNGTIKDMHGKITLTYNNDNKNLDVTYSNTIMGKSIFDIDWIYKNKVISYSIYNLSGGVDYQEAECTYIKIGHIDIVINMGGALLGTGYLPNNPVFLDKILYYCNDSVIDYVILSGSAQTNIFDLIGQSKKDEEQTTGMNGLLYNNKVKRIENIILLNKMFDIQFVLYENLKEALETGLNSGKIGQIIDPSTSSIQTIEICNHSNLKASLTFLNYSYPLSANKIDLLSIPLVISVNGCNYLNLGRLTDEYSEFQPFIKANETYFLEKKITYLTLPKFGRSYSNYGANYLKFLKSVLETRFGNIYLFVPGNYGTINSQGNYLYPFYGIMKDEFLSGNLYSSSVYLNQIVTETEGDLRGNIQFREKDTIINTSMRSEIKDNEVYRNVSTSTNQRAQSASKYYSV